MSSASAFFCSALGGATFSSFFTTLAGGFFFLALASASCAPPQTTERPRASARVAPRRTSRDMVPPTWSLGGPVRTRQAPPYSVPHADFAIHRLRFRCPGQGIRGHGHIELAA